MILIGVYYDSSGNFAGILRKDNHTLINHDSVGSFSSIYVYCDRDLRITGNDTHIYTNDTSITTYNLNLGQGWNVITYRIKISRNNYSKNEMLDGEPAGANWYFTIDE